MEAGIVRVRGVIRSASSEGDGLGRKVHLDEIRDEDPGEVRPIGFDPGDWVALEHDGVEQLGEFRLAGVVTEQAGVVRRLGAVVFVLVGDRDEGFAEQRVALAADLNPWAEA